MTSRKHTISSSGPASHTPAQVYNDCLSSAAYGQAVWHPYIPGGRMPADLDAQIGDVCYLDEGVFCRCFNVFRAADHELNRAGVPEDFTPL